MRRLGAARGRSGRGALVAILSAAALAVGFATPAAAKPEFAPYVDMTLSSDSLAQMMSQSGARHFTLGFIVSDPNSQCKASWGGYYGINDPTMNRRIAKLHAAGGDAIVSFGGAAGSELANTCATPGALAAQYQAVIDRYGIRELDFDIEGADQGNLTSLNRRFQAIARLQAAGRRAGKPVQVSLTLPVMPTGLTHDGVRAVRLAIQAGVHVDVVNVMAMDYYDPSLNYAGHMGDLAIKAASATHRQLARLYPNEEAAAVWRMVGITPMIGINDDNKEIFTTPNAKQVTAFAKSKRIGRIAMWSANRDRQCPTPIQYADNNCSGVSQTPWGFSKIFKTFGS